MFVVWGNAKKKRKGKMFSISHSKPIGGSKVRVISCPNNSQRSDRTNEKKKAQGGRVTSLS